MTRSIGSSGADTVYAGDGLPPWQATTNAPAAPDYCHAHTVSGTVYVFDAYNGHTLAYDPTEDAWTSKTAPPTTRRWYASAKASGLIYLMGGTDGGGTELASMDVYDPSANSWDTSRTSMPAARYGCRAVGAGATVVVAGGKDTNGDAQTTTYRYSDGGDSWSTGTAMPAARTDQAAVADQDGGAAGLGWFFGGLDTNSDPTATLWEYSIGYDEWNRNVTPVSASNARRQAAGFLADDGQVWFAGGTGVAGEYYVDVEAFDPAANEWTTQADLTEGRQLHGGAWADSSGYVFGGSGSNGTFQTGASYEGTTPVVTANGAGLFALGARGTDATLLKNAQTGVTGTNVFAKDGHGIAVTTAESVEIYKLPK